MSVVGRFRSEDEDSGNSFTFLASDNEEEEEERSNTVQPSSVARQKVKTPGGPKDIQTHVFVWGLNDKDQLGGPKGSKVRDSWLYDVQFNFSFSLG